MHNTYYMPGATESPIDTFIQLNLNIILKYLPYYWSLQ